MTEPFGSAGARDMWDAEGEDRTLSCVVCRYPRIVDGVSVGVEVEHIVMCREPPRTVIRGLHAECRAAYEARP